MVIAGTGLVWATGVWLLGTLAWALLAWLKRRRPSRDPDNPAPTPPFRELRRLAIIVGVMGIASVGAAMFGPSAGRGTAVGFSIFVWFIASMLIVAALMARRSEKRDAEPTEPDSGR